MYKWDPWQNRLNFFPFTFKWSCIVFNFISAAATRKGRFQPWCFPNVKSFPILPKLQLSLQQNTCIFFSSGGGTSSWGDDLDQGNCGNMLTLSLPRVTGPNLKSPTASLKLKYLEGWPCISCEALKLIPQEIHLVFKHPRTEKEEGPLLLIILWDSVAHAHTICLVSSFFPFGCLIRDPPPPAF